MPRPLEHQRLILLLVEHRHRPLRAFTIHETVRDDLGVTADDFPPKAAGLTVAHDEDAFHAVGLGLGFESGLLLPMIDADF